jgi:hypothetical protein
MEARNFKTSGAGEVQVFEVTMDNSEDQDELNRRLRKPGEPLYVAPSKAANAGELPPANTAGESAKLS